MANHFVRHIAYLTLEVCVPAGSVRSPPKACVLLIAIHSVLWHLSHSLVKMTDKMDEIYVNRKFSAQEPSEWRDFSIPVSNFTVFQPRI